MAAIHRAAEIHAVALRHDAINPDHTAKPRMMPIENFQELGPVGVLKPCCTTPAPAQLAGLSAACAGDDHSSRRSRRAVGDRASSLGKRALAHPNRGVRRRHALTLKLDHPSGAGQALMHEHLTHNKTYPTCREFADAILNFLRHEVPRKWG